MKKMNDKEFTERLWSNPGDNSPEFLQALEQDATRQQARQDAVRFEELLGKALRVPAPSAALEMRLRQIPEATRPVELPLRIAANEDSFFRRMLPVAAVLLVALGLGIYLQPDSNSDLAHDLFSHVYAETPYMNPNGSYTLDEVNTRLVAFVGAHLEASPATEALQVSFVKDCFVARQIAMHLVLHGNEGDVNVMLLPEQVSANEFSISDEQFNGIVAPAAQGTLVVIGNKQEPIREYRNVLSSNLGWEY
jgi:hypothetical protein